MWQPRRATKFLADAPDEILAVYDHPKHMDRYTVIYRTVERNDRGNAWVIYAAIGSDPNAFFQHDELDRFSLDNFRSRSRKNQIHWNDLPDVVKNAVMRDLNCTH